MSAPQRPPQSTPAISPASRYSRAIDLTDLNSAHTLGILAVPPGSLVLDVGAADGSVARELTARGCRVWAIELDRVAARAAEPFCERVLCGDAARILADELDEACRFDVILALDVLEHLSDPAAVLGAARRFLLPHGRLVASIPNVAHAAVRLQLLEGRFTRTDVGLLDATHLHFFDRPGVHALFRRSGYVICDELRTRKRLTETEIAVDVDTLPHDAVRLATESPDAETYQFIIIAAPATPGQARHESLLQAMQQRGEQADDQYRALETYARSLEQALAEAQSRLDALDESTMRRRLDEELREAFRLQTVALERQIDQLRRLHVSAVEETAVLRQEVARAAAAAAELDSIRGALHDAQARAAALEAAAVKARERAEAADRKSAGADAQAADLRRQSAQLRREVALRDAYVMELRRSLNDAEAEREASERLREDWAARQAQVERNAADLQAELDRARNECEQSALSLRETQAMPRYRLADGLNRVMKRVPLLHRLFKRWYFVAVRKTAR